MRRQSAKCNFSNENESLIDQITEKCSSQELRKKILLTGDTITVDKTITEAVSLETVERQLSDFKDKQNAIINKIKTQENKSINENKSECTRCGSANHKYDSDQCVAKDKICPKCGFKGHFFKMCRTKASKRKTNRSREVFSSKKKKKRRFDKPEVPKPSSKEPSKTVVDYIFHFDEDTTIKCHIGGTELDMLIDPGSKCKLQNFTS